MAIAQATTKRVFVERSAKTGLIIAKTCSICDEYIPLEDFAKDKKGFAECAASCKACTQVIKTRWAAVGRADLEALYAEGYTDAMVAEKFNITAGTARTRRNQCGLFEQRTTPVKMKQRPNNYY